MIDFHSHILPSFDDGAENIETSLSMLRKSAEQGINTVVSTSHFYANDNDGNVNQFLAGRKKAYDTLINAISKCNDSLPEIRLGAEVYLDNGISSLPNLEKLCIDGTNYILIEMPSDTWSEHILEEVYTISRRGLYPIIAHLDRFFNNEKQFSDLLSIDVVCQINASAFLSSHYRKKMLHLISYDAAHIIGSDMHNLTTRPQNLGEAYDIITKKFGKEYAEFFHNNAVSLLNNKALNGDKPPKLDAVKKMLL